MHETSLRTSNMYIIYFNTNVTAHTRLRSHKYYRTPQVVTTVRKTCAKIACKHLINIQLRDDLFTLATKEVHI